MELRPFGTLTLALSSDGLFMLGETPVGRRIIQEIASIEFTGEHFNARLKGKAAADWLAIDAGGIATFDIRMTLETNDGALVYLNYIGTADWSEGMATKPVYVTAKFETGDERYKWLNTAHVIGKGEVIPDGGGLAYEFRQVV
jgi:hypothetical protein